jgi:branched-chain amino acid transport system permease protein
VSISDILIVGVMNGLLSGALYVLIAVGLTLIYGVLHIVNFAHGAFLVLAMYAAFYLWQLTGVNPYLALPFVVVGAFCLSYLLYAFVVGPLGRGKDNNVLLITLGLSIVMENAMLFAFSGETRTVEVSLAQAVVQFGPVFVPWAKIISFFAALIICALFGLYVAFSDIGKAIRAVAKERRGALVVGIDVERIYAITFALGIACVAAAGCLLIPSYYVTPTSGNAFVLIAFTTVVLGGMGSFLGAMIGGLVIGVAESLGGLWLGEQLGQIAIPTLFVLVLLFKPTGLFAGAR